MVKKLKKSYLYKELVTYLPISYFATAKKVGKDPAPAEEIPERRKQLLL